MRLTWLRLRWRREVRLCMRVSRLVTAPVPALLSARSRDSRRENLGQVRKAMELTGPTRSLLTVILDQRKGELPIL